MPAAPFPPPSADERAARRALDWVQAECGPMARILLALAGPFQWDAAAAGLAAPAQGGRMVAKLRRNTASDGLEITVNLLLDDPRPVQLMVRAPLPAALFESA